MKTDIHIKLRNISTKVLLQWGQLNLVNNTWQTYTFPTAFTDGCHGLSTINLGQTAGSALSTKLNKTTTTTTSFSISCNGTGDSFFYIAIGY